MILLTSAVNMNFLLNPPVHGTCRARSLSIVVNEISGIVRLLAAHCAVNDAAKMNRSAAVSSPGVVRDDVCLSYVVCANRTSTCQLSPRKKDVPHASLDRQFDLDAAGEWP
jgi:hypothetical protein